MQAVVGLCHFCENHGPRVVMTCQPMREFDSNEAGPLCPPSSSISPSTSSAPQGPIVPVVQLENESDIVRLGGCGMGMSHHDRPRSNDSSSMPFHYGNCVRMTLDTEDRCNACSSFGDGPCLLSNDHPNRTSYISSEVALQERVYERVRNACLRSLSCEVSTAPRKNSTMSPTSRPSTPRRNEGGGTSASTGIRKTTAITIGGGGGGNTIHMSSTADDPDLNAEEADGCVIFGDVDNGFCFAYTFRLADAKARGFLRLFSLIVVSNDLTFLTNNFDYFKNSLGAIKSKLQSLAADTYSKEMMQGEKYGDEDVLRPEYANVVGRMPRWFRRKIAIDTDRNLVTITSEKEIWGILHRQMMWTLRSPTLTCRDQVMEGKPTQDMMVLMELEESTIVELELHHPNQHAVSMNQLANLKWIASQIESGGEPGDLDLLIRHVVTGGQIVIESKEQSLCRQFLLALSNLLPIGCLKLATYKEQYLPEYSTRFNLIGGPINIDVPLEVSDVMVLRISCRDYLDQFDENMSLKDCHVQVRRRPEKDGVYQHPQIVKRYKELLLDPDVNDTILETTLRTTREYWMSKAKICYQMMSQLRSQSSFVDVFQVINGICNEDRQVVLFWQAGLSNAYKNHVLASIEQPKNMN